MGLFVGLRAKALTKNHSVGELQSPQVKKSSKDHIHCAF
jgi:hypothetical protein